MNEICIFLVFTHFSQNLSGCTIFNNASLYTDVLDVKILESCAKSFYKFQNIIFLKGNITGLRDVEILKITWGLFTGKETDGTKQ